jgi:hypothetical protein
MLTTTATTAATASATAASPASTATAATVSGHLVQTRVNLLLGLGKNLNEVTSLLGVFWSVSQVCLGARVDDTYSQQRTG